MIKYVLKKISIGIFFGIVFSIGLRLAFSSINEFFKDIVFTPIVYVLIVLLFLSLVVFYHDEYKIEQLKKQVEELKQAREGV